MTFIEAFIRDYGMIAIFVLIFAEYACFPVSSEIVLPLAGIMASECGLSFPALLMFSTAAGLLGSFLTYLAGRLGGAPLLNRLTGRFPSLEKPVNASYRAFERHGKAAIFFSRLIPLCRTYIGFVAGAIKQLPGAYLIGSFFGIFIWNAVLTGLGYYFYHFRHTFFSFFDRFKHTILIIGILLLFLIFFHHLFRCRKKSETDPDK